MINGPGASAARVEFRQTAADINPYLAIAACLASGLYGIERGSTPPPPQPRRRQRRAARRCACRTTLERRDASCSARASSRAQVLPEAFIDHYVRTRDWEVRQHAQERQRVGARALLRERLRSEDVR